MYTVPALTVVFPVNVLAAVRLKVLVSEVSLTIDPPPEITPEIPLPVDDEYWKVAPVEIFNVTAEPLVKFEVPATCKVPAVTLVAVEDPYVLVPLNTTLPPCDPPLMVNA